MRSNIVFCFFALNFAPTKLGKFFIRTKFVAMIRKVFLLCLSLLYAQVQDYEPPKVEKIPYLGLRIISGRSRLANNELNPDTTTNLRRQFTLGFLAGITLGYRFSKNFSLEILPTVANLGETYFGKTFQGDNFIRQSRITYIQLAVLPRGQLRLNAQTYLNVSLGPYVAALVNASESFENEPINFGAGGIAAKDLYRLFAFGYQIGVGLEVFFSQKFGVEFLAQWMHTITDIENKKLQWLNPASRQQERFYDNYYSYEPWGEAMREALFRKSLRRVEPTHITLLGLSVSLNYYFVKL